MHGAVLSLVLAANVVPAEHAERAVRLAVAPAVWRVDLSLRAEGIFPRFEKDERVGTDTVATVGLGFGSATAVSADGYLLTSVHVISPVNMAAEACIEVFPKRYGKPVAHAMRAEYLFTDLAGGTVAGQVDIVPVQDGGNICDNPTAARWSNRKASPVRIIALDTVADLALVRIAGRGIPFISSKPATPAVGEGVYSFGYNSDGKLVSAVGTFTKSCDSVSVAIDSDEAPHPVPQPQLLASAAFPLRQGMSGGPLMAGALLAGINTLVDMDCDCGDCEDTGTAGWVVPGPYVHAWYLWASGRSTKRPTKVCDLPKE